LVANSAKVRVTIHSIIFRVLGNSGKHHASGAFWAWHGRSLRGCFSYGVFEDHRANPPGGPFRSLRLRLGGIGRSRSTPIHPRAPIYISSALSYCALFFLVSGI
jgi:hypothetical protein